MKIIVYCWLVVFILGQNWDNGYSSEVINFTHNWTLVNEEKNITIRNITIPSSVHTILQQAGLINDPLVGFNDAKLRWIVYDSWSFQLYIPIEDIQNITKCLIYLEFGSIDTIATVHLNSKFILFAQNQFIRYKSFDIFDYLNLSPNGVNFLEIKFSSPVLYARSLAEISSADHIEPPECPPDVQQGECHVNLIRKQQCSFSWDWGPAFAPIGLNGFVKLNIIQNFDFNFSVSVYPTRKGSIDNFVLDFTFTILPFDQILEEGFINISIKELNFGHSTTTNFISKNIFRLVTYVDKDTPFDLWWPNGRGKQNLYNLTVEIIINNISIQKSKQIGFRSVELVQDPIPNGDGLTFYFKINNQTMFLQGSNWIPADSFQEKITDHYLDWLFESMVDSKMNVLRVWGGGVYESDKFYDLADESGILIWQDFMFACALYPTNPDFIVNIQQEIEYQVNRLRHHPSILLWSGNNENEAALATNWYNTKQESELYYSEYRKLYIDTIMTIVNQKDPELSRPFLSSSPTNGRQTIKENWISQNPYDLLYGDLHFYNYDINGWDHNLYPIPRFMSEFGVQSLPSYSTLSQAYNFPDDADIFGDMSNHRQHHGNGNQQIINEIKKNLDLPVNSTNDPVKYFKSIIYLSQINQAMTLKTATELFRRSKNQIDVNNSQGNCMGTMYWQFNDVWQAPTWSTIEYGGKWKLAHYFIKNSYSSQLISPTINDTHIIIHAVSDLDQDIQSTFNLRIYHFDSLVYKYDNTYMYEIKKYDSRIILTIDLEPILAFTGCFDLNCFLKIRSNFDDFENFLFFKKQINSKFLKNSNIKIDSIEKTSDVLFTIKLTTYEIGFFVYLDIESEGLLPIIYGRFSENGFHMTDQSKTITYETFDSNLTINDLKNFLIVKSLSNVY